MNVKLVANGKTVDYEISDTEYNRLFTRTGLEKPVACEEFYAVNFSNGDIDNFIWNGYKCDETFFDCGLMSTDKKLAQDRFRARKIKTKLERFAAEHNKGALNWNLCAKTKWYLYYDFTYNEVDVNQSRTLKIEGTTYFSSEKIAKQAIKELNKDGELIWYLRDYQPWIGAYEETEER